MPSAICLQGTSDSFYKHCCNITGALRELYFSGHIQKKFGINKVSSYFSLTKQI